MEKIHGQSILVLETLYPQKILELAVTQGHSHEALQIRENPWVSLFEKAGLQATRIVANDMAGMTSNGMLRKILWRVKFGFWQKYALISRIPFVNIILEKSPFSKAISNISASRHFDFVFCMNPNLIPSREIKKLFPNAKIISSIASPLPPKKAIMHYDLILTSLPPIANKIRELGVNVAEVPAVFDAGPIVDLYKKEFQDREYDLAFVGSFGVHHLNTLFLARAASKECSNFVFYGYGPKWLLYIFGLSANYKGPAYGPDMLEVLGNAKLSLNRHAWFAEGHANNVRMYESTAMGCVLLTDNAIGLPNLFSEGEVCVYKNSKDLRSKIRLLLSDQVLARRIANLGHARYMRSHTLSSRIGPVSEALKSTLY